MKRICVENNDIFAYVGRLSGEKGIRLFCQAVTDANVKGVVIGDGILADEEESYKAVKNINDNAILCPDSVILISDIFTDDAILKHVSDKIAKEINSMSKYIVFQISRAEGKII